MSDLTFGPGGRAYFPTKYHGEFSISKPKWDEICAEPERFYYRQNGEKIATTLINPDYVRHSQRYQNQFLYYKRYETVRIDDREVVARLNYWAVIIDRKTRHICTVYPTDKPKSGKEYKGESAS